MFIIVATVDALPSAEIMQEIKDTVQDEIAIEIVEVAVPKVFFMRDTIDTDIDICLECPIDVKCIGIYYAPCLRSGARKVYKMDSKSIEYTFSHRQTIQRGSNTAPPPV